MVCRQTSAGAQRTHGKRSDIKGSYNLKTFSLRNTDGPDGTQPGNATNPPHEEPSVHPPGALLRSKMIQPSVDVNLKRAVRPKPPPPGCELARPRAASAPGVESPGALARRAPRARSPRRSGARTWARNERSSPGPQKRNQQCCLWSTCPPDANTMPDRFPVGFNTRRGIILPSYEQPR